MLELPFDEYLERLCLDEIGAKAELAINAIAHVFMSSDEIESVGNPNIFASIYSHLYFTSNVALTLWPSKSLSENIKGMRKFRERRGRHLRDLLELPDEHYFSNQVFRNHIAHIDERLDEWWVTSKNRNIGRRWYVTDRTRIIDLDSSDIFECYIENEHLFFFMGQEYDLKRSVDELK
ncbi:MAG: hypothetical protein RIE56_12905, partial [Amphiplicatus sp.]